VILGLAASAYAADPLVYVGTYTDSGSKGIYAFRLQTKQAKLLPLGVAAETTNPSFLIEDPEHRFLYAANENGTAAQMGSVSAFAIDAQTGKLTPLNWMSSRGGGPCHLALDRTARWLAAANYDGGSIVVLPVQPDGKLGDAAAYGKTGGHPRGVAFSPDNRFLFVADVGLDRIFLYHFDAERGIVSNPVVAAAKPGAGVRHLAFHPSGRALYAINEIASTVTVYSYNAPDGRLEELQTLTTLPGFSSGNTAAELVLNTVNTMLYTSNRGHDSVYSFEIDPNRLTLAPAGDCPTLGSTPRHFAIDPSGEVLVVANQGSNDLAIFKIHARTGQLTPAGKLVTGVPRPAFVLFVP